MAINFPTSLDTLSNPTSTDLLENANAALDHDVQHSNANDAIEALEAKVGANSSAVTTSHDYKLSGVTGSDKAVSKTGTETLTNKTLTAPQINMGSDANGDLIIRNGAGVTARLPIGTTDQILAVQSGLPTWIANPSATAASQTAAGVIEIATTAEQTTGTDDTRASTPKSVHDMTSLAGAAWFLDEDTMSSDSATKTASQQSIKAYADGLVASKNSSTTYTISTASGTQTIAHGLGRVPKMVRIFVMSSTTANIANWFYNGTTSSVVGFSVNNGANRDMNDSGKLKVYGVSSNETEFTTGTITVDATNISISWVKTNSPTGTLYMNWEAV